MSLFYKSLTYKEGVDFKRRKRKFKDGKPCAICGKTFPPEQMMIAHLVPVRELTNKKALLDEDNWEVRCINCERRLHREEQLRDNQKSGSKESPKVTYLREQRRDTLKRQEHYRNHRAAEQELRLRRLSSGFRRKRGHKRWQKREDYYDRFTLL